MPNSNTNMVMKQEIYNPETAPSSVTIGNSYAVGIQATPGTKFCFNKDDDSDIITDIITMGPSGIYQINFFEPIITSIYFDTTVNSLPIIIDYVQQGV